MEAFCLQRVIEPAPAAWPLVLTFDGNGIVMLPDALRPATAKAAAAAQGKLATRLSPGEKNGRKRMAELACVYDAAPVPRRPEEIISTPAQKERKNKAQARRQRQKQKPREPQARGKWLTASVTDDIPAVIAAAFDEAERRDPQHKREWPVLIDGNNTQIEAVTAEAARGITVTIVIDFIHVLEYLWKAAWSFSGKGEPASEVWVADQARKILIGQMVNLLQDGQPVRLSKRAGNVVTLDDLIEAAGTDAARYALARASTDSPIDLDIDLLTSQTAAKPVFCVQYAYARLSALQRHAAEMGISRGAPDGFDGGLLTHQRESGLLGMPASSQGSGQRGGTARGASGGALPGAARRGIPPLVGHLPDPALPRRAGHQREHGPAVARRSHPGCPGQRHGPARRVGAGADVRPGPAPGTAKAAWPQLGYLDTVTGQVCPGRVSPADREHLRAWLARHRERARDDVEQFDELLTIRSVALDPAHRLENTNG